MSWIFTGVIELHVRVQEASSFCFTGGVARTLNHRLNYATPPGSRDVVALWY